MYPANLDVVVIGGSLSGLFTSVVLESLDNVSKVTVLERYDIGQLQDLGAGIRCNTEVIRAIQEFFDVPPEKYAAPTSFYRMLDQDDNIFLNHPTSGFCTSWGQLYRVLRERFDSSTKCFYRHGCTLTEFEETDESTLVVDMLNEEGEKEQVSANLVIGADGASSKARSLVFPEVSRESAGYVCYRGLVHESLLSESARNLYNKAGTFSYPKPGQFVSYLVPGNEATADNAIRLINWAWYKHKSQEELAQLMLDKNGIGHRFSLPYGCMRDEEVTRLHDDASAQLASLHAEVVKKTTNPFVQVVTDSFSKQNHSYGGKLILVGDAVGGQRPHTASAMLQSALHGLLVRKLVQGEVDLMKCSQGVEAFSTLLCESGKQLGSALMTKDLRTSQERSAEYLSMFMPIQGQLNSSWRQLVEMGDAVAAL